jgi:hypothetical protein
MPLEWNRNRSIWVTDSSTNITYEIDDAMNETTSTLFYGTFPYNFPYTSVRNP